MTYALINDNKVTALVDETEDINTLSKNNQHVITAPPNCLVGWVLDGNKVKPAYDVQTQKINEVSGSNYVDISVEKRKIYSEDMMERFKKRNMSTGNINIAQAMWMHHRLRALPVTFVHPILTNGEYVSMTLDLMNLAIPGDVEVSCIALQCIHPSQFDDMSKPYHYFTSEVRDWLVADMKKFLGW